MEHLAPANQFLHDVGHLLGLTILFEVGRAFSVVVVAHKVWVVQLLKSADLSVHVQPKLLSVEHAGLVYDLDGKLVTILVLGELDLGAVAHAEVLFKHEVV